MATAFDKQIQNRNFLSPVGFKFTLAKEPKVAFFCNATRIPDINLGSATQPTYLRDIPVPGDKIEFGDFNLRFLVDENMENYMAIHNWIYGLGYPNSTQEYKSLITDSTENQDPKQAFSDGSLHILNSNFNSVATINFKDLWPTSLSSLEFDASIRDTNYFTADVYFKYTVYNILSPDTNQPL
jgi:hypothetical protein